MYRGSSLRGRPDMGQWPETWIRLSMSALTGKIKAMLRLNAGLPYLTVLLYL